MYLHPDVLELMRRAHLRTAVLFTESPYQDQEQARLAQLVDVCWTNERTSVSFLRQFNPCTFYVRHAYDPERHQPVAHPADVAAHDVVFVGSGFQERLDLLASVHWSGIDLGLYGTWTLLPARHPLRRHIRAGLIDNDMATALYSRAKIGLNLHRRSCHYERAPVMIPRADSMNPRAYELAACGIFQISDRRAEVQETFGTSVPTFDNPAALERLVRLALADDAGRTYLAEQARLAIAPHTFAARAAQLIAELESLEQRPIAKGA
jgi:spore maturation protein CgeB